MAMLHVLFLLTSFWVLKFLWASSYRSSPAGCGLCPWNKGKDSLDYKRQNRIWYRSFVTFSPVMNPLELAKEPTVYVTWQGEGICLVASANQLSVSLYQRLAPSLPHENSAGQKLRVWTHTHTEHTHTEHTHTEHWMSQFELHRQSEVIGPNASRR